MEEKRRERLEKDQEISVFEECKWEENGERASDEHQRRAQGKEEEK